MTGLLDMLSGSMKGTFLFGEKPTVAYFYLFFMLLWAERFDVEVPEPMVELRTRMRERPAVDAAMAAESLTDLKN
nr:glutathione binding-like protein [Mesorhizobium sp.]